MLQDCLPVKFQDVKFQDLTFEHEIFVRIDMNIHTFHNLFAICLLFAKNIVKFMHTFCFYCYLK